MERIKPKNYNFLEKFSYYQPGIGGMFALLGMLLLGSLVANVIAVPLIGVFGGINEMGDALLYVQFISYPLMFIPPMLFAAAQSRNNSFNKTGSRLDNNHFQPLGLALCAVLVVLGTLAVSYCGDALTEQLPEMPAFLEEALKSLTTGDNLVINFIMVSIFAPFFEEWLCRGMVLRGLLANKMKPVWAIVVSAVFFGFIHFNPWQAIPAFLIGLLLGYVYYKTGSLKLTMLMHFANNTMALVLSNQNGLEDVEGWGDILTGPQYWIIFAGCVLLTALIILAFKRIQLERPEGNIDPVKPLFEE